MEGFTKCFLSSGALSFFGDGYWYDRMYRIMFPSFNIIDTITFVAKTMTIEAKAGNMPMNSKFQPKELIPKSIRPYPIEGAMINYVGLSNPGARILFDTGKWQNMSKPFFLSFMAVKETIDERINETREFIEILMQQEFKTKVGLQVNISCPNTKHDTKKLIKESLEILKEFERTDFIIDLKINALVEYEMVKEIEDSNLCSVLTISNSIPYGSEGIDWSRYDRKKGGLSGTPIFGIVIEKISELREKGVRMPIKGSGGIMSAKQVDIIKEHGANSIEIGTVMALRPWRVKSIIRRAEEVF